jgi:hypothetical protein
VFSEPFPTHAEALAAARAAAQEQEVPGHMETIEYEDDKGAGETARTPSSGTKFKLFTPRPARLTERRKRFAIRAITDSVQNFWRE